MSTSADGFALGFSKTLRTSDYDQGISLCFSSSTACCLTRPSIVVISSSLSTILVLMRASITESSTYIKEWAWVYWVIYSGPRVGTDLTWISRMSTGRGRCVARKQRITVLLPAVVSRRLTATSKAVALGYVLPTYASCPQRISGKMGRLQLRVSTRSFLADMF